MRLAGLCKGSTADSDSVCEGSNPSPAAKQEQFAHPGGLLLFFRVPAWDSNPHIISIASRSAKGAEGSNPSPAATSSQAAHRLRRLFCIAQKSPLALVPLLLLSKAKPCERYRPCRQLRPFAAPGFAFVQGGSNPSAFRFTHNLSFLLCTCVI